MNKNSDICKYKRYERGYKLNILTKIFSKTREIMLKRRSTTNAHNIFLFKPILDIHIFISFSVIKRMELFAGTVPANNTLFAGTTNQT